MLGHNEINLIDETIRILAKWHKKPEDVKWVGHSDGKKALSWEKFVELAKDIIYNHGHGSQEINANLVIVGEGWWLGRHEYDGSEWWVFNTMPTLAKNAKHLTINDIKYKNYKPDKYE
jgi:hypothetical protein